MKVYNGMCATGHIWFDLDEETLFFCFDNFLTIANYNGYEDNFKEIYTEFKKAQKQNLYCVTRPSNWETDNVDRVDGVFWSWLVLNFGDYGTSPRFGWVYKENINIVIKLFEDYYKENT